MLDRLLRAIYLILFAAVPLLMSPLTSELFEFNKMIFIYVTAVVVFFLWSLKSVVQKKFIFKRSLFDIFFLLFILSQILSTIFSIDFHTSIFGYYGRFNGGLISIIAYFVLYYGYVSNFDRKFTVKAIVVGLLSSVIVILWGLPGKLGVDSSCVVFTQRFNNSCWTDQFRPSERMFSTLGQPNWLGQFLLIYFFIGFYFYLQTKKKVVAYALFVYLVFSAVCILFTRSRSAIGALVVGVALFPFFISTLQKKTKLLIGVLVLAVIIFKTGSASIDKYLTLSTYLPKKTVMIVTPQPKNDNLNITESFDIRKIVWQGAVDLGLKNPLFGTGVETFAYSYYLVRPVAHNLTSEWDFIYNKAHNEYLNYFATTGFFGLGTYLLMIGVVLIYLIRNLRKDKLLFTLLFSYVGVLVTNFVGFSTSSINLFFFLVPAMAVTLVEHNVVKAEVKKATFKYGPRDYLLGFMAFIVSASLIFFLYNYYQADLIYAKATAAYDRQDYYTAASYFQEALALHFEHVYEDKLSYSLANLAFLMSTEPTGKDQAAKLKFAAEYYNTLSLRASPKNLFYWKTRAKNSYLFYQISLDKAELEKGIATLETAKKFAPTDPKLYYSEALYFSLLESDAKVSADKLVFQSRALEEIDKAIELRANFYDAYLLKAQMLRKFGKKEEAATVLNYMLKIFGQNDQTVKKELESP